MSFTGPWYGIQLSSAQQPQTPTTISSSTATCQEHGTQACHGTSPAQVPVPCTTRESVGLRQTILQTATFVPTASIWQRGCVCIRRDFATIKSMTRLKKLEGRGAMDDATPLLPQMDKKSEMDIAMDNNLRSSPLVPMKTAHAVPCTPRALPLVMGPRIYKSPHYGLQPPPWSRHRSQGNEPSPHPQGFFLSLQPCIKVAVAVSHAATPAEEVHATSNKYYARPANCHPGQPSLQLEITATRKDLDPGCWSCANSVQQNDVNPPNKTITTDWKVPGSRRVTSLASTSKSSP